MNLFDFSDKTKKLYLEDPEFKDGVDKKIAEFPFAVQNVIYNAMNKDIYILSDVPETVSSVEELEKLIELYEKVGDVVTLKDFEVLLDYLKDGGSLKNLYINKGYFTDGASSLHFNRLFLDKLDKCDPTFMERIMRHTVKVDALILGMGAYNFYKENYAGFMKAFDRMIPEADESYYKYDNATLEIIFSLLAKGEKIPFILWDRVQYTVDVLNSIGVSTDILKNLSVNALFQYGILAEKGLITLDIARLPADVITAIASEPDKEVDTDKLCNFYKKHSETIAKFAKNENTDWYTTYINLVSNKSKFFDTFDKFFDLYLKEDFELLARVSDYIPDLTDECRCFFDIDWSLEQKEVLFANFRAAKINNFKTTTGREIIPIIKYARKDMSVDFLRTMRTAIIERVDISTLNLSSGVSAEHLKHEIFFKGRGITFENDDDYDKKYVEFMNEAYKDYARIDNSMAALGAMRDGKNLELHTLINLQKDYNFNVDIDGMINSFYTYRIDVLSRIAIAVDKTGVDSSEFLNGKYNNQTLMDIAEALENGKDYKPFLKRTDKSMFDPLPEQDNPWDVVFDDPDLL